MPQRPNHSSHSRIQARSVYSALVFALPHVGTHNHWPKPFINLPAVPWQPSRSLEPSCLRGEKAWVMDRGLHFESFYGF